MDEVWSGVWEEAANKTRGGLLHVGVGSLLVGLGVCWCHAGGQSGSGSTASWEVGKVACQKLALKWCSCCPTAPAGSCWCALCVGMVANAAPMQLQ